MTLFVALVLDMQICHNSNAIDLDALDVNFTAPEIIQTKILNQSADQVRDDPCENNLCVCWSDVFGQELYKLAVGWLIGQIGTILGAIVFRWIRSCIQSKSTKSKFEFFVAFDLTDNVLKVVRNGFSSTYRLPVQSLIGNDRFFDAFKVQARNLYQIKNHKKLANCLLVSCVLCSPNANDHFNNSSLCLFPEPSCVPQYLCQK